MKIKDNEKWYIRQISENEWCVESQKFGTIYIQNAHCSACARIDVLTKYGGWFDLRGLHTYGTCFYALSYLNSITKGVPLTNKEKYGERK